MTVECAFGILKARFRCLLVKLPFRDINIICATVSVCVLLHNMLIADRDSSLDNTFDLELDVGFVERLVEAERRQSQQHSGAAPTNSADEDSLAVIKRNALRNEICK